MVDPITPAEVPPNGATPQNGAAAESTPRDQMIADVVAAVSAKMEDQFSSWSADHARKTGKEVGKIRHLFKQISGDGETPDPQPAGGDSARDARYATPADVQAAMRLGELRAQLPEGLRDRIGPALEKKPLAAQAELLELVLMAATAETTGATPTPRTDRTVRSPTRSAAPHPRTLKEYTDLTKSEAGRARKAELDQDDSFHPEDLPYHLLST